MVTTKTIAPEVRACGEVLSAVASKLSDIGHLAAAASRMHDEAHQSAALEAIEALALQAGALADGAAVAAGASGCLPEAEDWVFGEKRRLIANIMGGAAGAQGGAQ